jgi:hypothetical protein
MGKEPTCSCAKEREELDAHSRRLWRDERGDICVEAFEHRCCCETPRYFARISTLGSASGEWQPLVDLTLESADHVLALLPQAIGEMWEREMSSRPKECPSDFYEKKDVFFKDRYSVVVLAKEDDEGCEWCDLKKVRVIFERTTRNGGAEHLFCISPSELGLMRSLIEDASRVLDRD